MVLRTALAATALVLSSTAWAANCDSYVRAAGTAKGEALIKAYKGLASCDVEQAKADFPTFMRAAGDLETLTPLTIAAIDVGAWNGVWRMMGKVPYQHRDTIAKAVGDACGDHDQVLTFLQGAYAGLKGTDFAAWGPALEACESDAFGSWLQQVAAEPPQSSYNEKYDAILGALSKTQGASALPVLEKAAVLAGTNGGPFNNILDTMQRSIQPDDFSKGISDEDQAAMEQALVRVASAGVTSDNAMLVVQRLYTAGNEALAASLLPSVYPTRVQDGGGLMWGAAAVESCDEQAIVHWLTFTEEPKRIAIVEAVSGPLRGTKAKLKCTPEGEWPVFATDEPLRSRDDATGWIAEIVGEWSAKGLKVKAVEEKKLQIP